MRKVLLTTLFWAGTAAAQDFTTAAEVKPILEITKGNWIAVREWEGSDLIYFTQLESWRCGLDRIDYAVNGGDPVPYDPEPCYADEAQPNALKIPDGHFPYVTLPLKSVETVSVTVTYDDGTTQTEVFERAKVMTP